MGSTFDPIHLDFDSGTNQSVAAITASLISWSLASAEDLMNGMSKVLLPKAPYLCGGGSISSIPVDTDDGVQDGLMLLWNMLFIGVSFTVVQAGIILVHRWKEPDENTAEG